VIEDHEAGAGRALVDRADEVTHLAPPFSRGTLRILHSLRPRSSARGLAGTGDRPA
jgi:hypothetical protein